MSNASAQKAAVNAAMLRDYWRESRRPLVSLVFISPLLVAYEGGVLWLGPQAMRNGAEVWLRSFLDILGFGQYFLLPLLTVGLLLGWHHTTHERWYVPVPVLSGMAGECLSLALGLVAIGYLQGALMHTAISTFAPMADGVSQLLGRAIGFCGAGIYEEVLFRLTLLPMLMLILRLCGVNTIRAVWGAIGLSSVLFSLAHYVGPQGDTFTWFGFLFRFIAGAFFALLFVKRGFGIAAGTHALYDIFVGLW